MPETLNSNSIKKGIFIGIGLKIIKIRYIAPDA